MRASARIGMLVCVWSRPGGVTTLSHAAALTVACAAGDDYRAKRARHSKLRLSGHSRKDARGHPASQINGKGLDK